MSSNYQSTYGDLNPYINNFKGEKMNKGFTLLEIMIALMVFSIFSIAVISSLNTTLIASQHATAKSIMNTNCQRVVLQLADDISSSEIINISDDFDEVTYRRITSVNPIVYSFVRNVSFDQLSSIYDITDKYEGNLNGLSIPTEVPVDNLKGFFIIRNKNTVVIGLSLIYNGPNTFTVSFETEVILRAHINKE